MSNSAMLVTRFLPDRLKKNLAYGFEARWLEITTYPKGYGNVDVHAQTKVNLISDARQAHALGLIAYLPEWAKQKETTSGAENRRSEESDGVSRAEVGTVGGASTHDDTPNTSRRAGRVGNNPR